MAHDVFVSYSAKDKPTADAVVATLEARGIRCWIAPRDVLAGMHYGEAIIDAINASKAMVLVFSKNANESGQIRLEVERAVSKGISIIPVRIEDVAPGKSLEYFIGPVHWLDALTPPLERHLEQLASTIHVLLKRTAAAAAPATPAPIAPVRGTVPRIPGMPLATGAGLRRFILPAAAVALIVILALVWRSISGARAAPEIVSIAFPRVIKADGVRVQGYITFRDANGDLKTAEFAVLEASTFNPGKFDPNGVAGVKEGRFSFFSVSNVPQRVTQRVTLVDRAGHRSKPVTFTFEAVPVPVVTLRTIRVAQKDEFRDQRKGAAFHVYAEIGNAKDKDLTAVATLHEQNGNSLPAKSAEYSIRNTVGTSIRFRPRFDETVMKDMTLFVPFDQFPEIAGSTPYRARIQIFDGEKAMGNPYWHDFTLTRPK
ncbi:MAG: toll/interleukin-1 receptor domain-containing protein [Armatimonadota bacterium]